MDQFVSKRELYRDFDLAIKLITDIAPAEHYYARIQDALRWDDQAKLEQLREKVRAWDGSGTSVAFIVELPAFGDAKDPIGHRFVLLPHESGPECFVDLASPEVVAATIALLVFLRNKAFDELYKATKTVVLAELGPELKRRWQEFKGGARISAVELRTERRGVCRTEFSSFDLDELECLLRKMAKFPAAPIIDFNRDCFAGRLFEFDATA